MEIKPKIVPLIAFLSLVFLLHELHDWAHTMMAGGLCHCWAPRAFDTWSLCPRCVLDGREHALIWMVGPLFNYVAIWAGWNLMDPENTLEKRSTGFCLLFAALPLPRIMAALAGGGDETSMFRELLPTYELRHHHLVSLIGLIFILAMTLPALIRAFLLLPGWKGKLLVFPAYLLLPGLIDHWVVHIGMNKLSDMGVLSHLVITGLHLLVLVWLAFILLVFLVSSGGLSQVLAYDEKEGAII
jgi:hypothetical protein